MEKLGTVMVVVSTSSNESSRFNFGLFIEEPKICTGLSVFSSSDESSKFNLNLIVSRVWVEEGVCWP